MISPFANIYIAVMNRLKELVPEINWIDFDLGQLEAFDGVRPPVEWPCLLIDFNNTEFDPRQGYQDGNVNMLLRLAFDQYQHTDSEMPQPVLEQALTQFEIEHKVHQALQAWAAGGLLVNPLIRLNAASEKRSDDNFRVRRLAYTGTFSDNDPDFALVTGGGSSGTAVNWTGFTFDEVTGLFTLTGATTGGLLTQIDLLAYPGRSSYVNGFNEGFSISAIGSNSTYLRYLTPGQLYIRWRRVTPGTYTPVSGWTEELVTINRLTERKFTLYENVTNSQFSSLLFPGNPINVNGDELATVTNMDDYITAMNADAANQAVIHLESWEETGRIDVLVSPVTPYQNYGSWNRILKIKRVF